MPRTGRPPSPRVAPRNRPEVEPSPRTEPARAPRPGPEPRAERRPDAEATVGAELAGGRARPIDGIVRALFAVPWSEARRLVESGKIEVDGRRVTDARVRVRAGQSVALHMRAPRPSIERIRSVEVDLFVHVDAQVAVVRKPAGISTVPFGDTEDPDATLDALVREALVRKARAEGRSLGPRAPLGVVQRLDKATSGLLVFARTVAAKKDLAAQLREHSVHRAYEAIAHGEVRKATHRTHLVADRGDGLRGSAERMRARGRGAVREGQLATTHVEPIASLRGATHVRCRLETGRTHQIRIHLAEAGHPLLGESVYVRDYRGTLIPAPRLMLHAAELGFVHPETGEEMHFSEPPPEDFQETLARLR